MGKTYFIYVIGFNSKNPNLYVGYTCQTAQQRFEQHKFDTYNGERCDIHNAMRKYGADNAWQIVVMTVKGITDSQAKDLETWWISKLDTLKNGYNMRKGAKVAIRRKAKNALPLRSNYRRLPYRGKMVWDSTP